MTRPTADVVLGADSRWAYRLPGELRAQGAVTGSGELLWPLAAAGKVVQSLPGLGLGILGGEVYLPFGAAQASFLAGWTTTPAWALGQAWRSFTERASAQAEAVLAASATPRPTVAARGSELVFLAVCSELECRRELERESSAKTSVSTSAATPTSPEASPRRR